MGFNLFSCVLFVCISVHTMYVFNAMCFILFCQFCIP